MPFPSARLALLSLILLVAPFVATASDDPVAIEIPANADILITDGRGVIVGAGEAEDGTTFRLALVEGFSGPATLIFVLDDGSFQEIGVAIGEGGVSIGGRFLSDLVASVFAHVAIGRETPGSGPPGEASRPGGEIDDGPVGLPPVATPPAGTPPGASTPAGASRGRGAPGDDPAPGPPVEERPADDGTGGPAATDAPPVDAPPVDAPPVEPSTDVRREGEDPSESADDAPDRRRP